MPAKFNLPRLSLSTTIFITTVLAAILVIYVFGLAAVLHALGWACLGLVIGWLAGFIKRVQTQRGILLDLLTGAAGAVFGVLLFGGGSVYEGGPLERILSSMVGSVFLLFVAALGEGFLTRRETDASRI